MSKGEVLASVLLKGEVLSLHYCFSFKIILGLLGRTEGEREGKSIWFEKGEYIYLKKKEKNQIKKILKKMMTWKIVERSKASVLYIY